MSLTSFVEGLWSSQMIYNINRALIPYKKSILGAMDENIHRTYMALLQSGRFKRADWASGESQKNFYLRKFDKQTYLLISEIRKATGIDQITLDMYFRFLIDAGKTGKIPYEKWDPVGYQITRTAQKKFQSEVTLPERATGAIKRVASVVPLLLVTAVVVAGVVLMSKFQPKEAA